MRVGCLLTAQVRTLPPEAGGLRVVSKTGWLQACSGVLRRGHQQRVSAGR
jgi:hypothetical protein